MYETNISVKPLLEIQRGGSLEYNMFARTIFTF